MKLIQVVFLMIVSSYSIISQAQNDKPLRLGVAGLSHGHLWEVLSRLDRGDFEVVGVAEKNIQLWDNKLLKAKVANNLFFQDLDDMLDQTKPEAVIVYESIYDHLRVVEACAPRGIHVMVEKPLATTVEQAQRIAELAKKYNIMVLTNYETTWYPANHKAYELVNKEQSVGKISRINVYDGHSGPVEIGCSPEFLGWLTDPVKNGGGAVIDFGCYGANLSTWLMGGQKPVSVFATLKHQKPDVYPNVDDDATIVLEYPDVTTIIMASWNWPMSRKDMHIYGNKGYIYQDNATDMRIGAGEKETKFVAGKLPEPYNDSFYYLKAAVRGDIKVKPADLSSLENNLIVVEILEAAIKSNNTGEVIRLK
ncbi:gfo/Idh/MocA family oxidoreductase [Dysgonomonas sp. 521]|uniref:Gfo/Idh/MocA family protein n=1 Tax=Dysgonomonas sp. 521 TaxID=2302932 RepID=UPI0013D29B8E|nr:Gfo/Idh/MocA family oxidoreductase [Dysgonomonas sp. 521]NDV96055.1 gfo/Idh/MocA family oxidoreductase [Dysgonomonas sp. 521]